MRILHELPKNESFFNRYATLVPTLHKLSYLAQIISASTEWSVFFTLLYPKVLELFPQYAFSIAAIGATLLTAVVEIGLRTLTPYSVRTILYKRWQGLDLVMSIFILVVTTTLFAVSLLTSYMGSHEAVNELYTTGKSRTAIDSQLQEDRQGIFSRYTADSTQTAQSFNSQIIAAETAEKAAVNVKKEQVRIIERREVATGQSFLSKKLKLREEIAAIEADGARQVSDLQTAKSLALATLLSKREFSTGEAKTAATTGVAKLENKGARYGGALAYFTVICHFFFLLSIIMQEVVKKGSDIQEKAVIGKYQFDQSIIGEWWNVFSDKFQTHWRTKIRAWATRTPEHPAPTDLPTLYEYEREQKRVKVGAKQRENNVEIAENVTDNSRETVENQPANGYDAMFKEGVDLDDLFEQNGHSHNGNGYSLNNQFATDTLTSDPPKRVVIQGFQPTGQSVANGFVNNATVNNAEPMVKHWSEKECENCGRTYQAKVIWQRFCSSMGEGNCKDDWHSKQHGGQVFNPKQYHKTKKK